MRRVALSSLLIATVAIAHGRPDEASLFGGNPDAGSASTAAPPVDPASATLDDSGRPIGPVSNGFETGRLSAEPAKVGGQLYMRAYAQGAQHTSPDNTHVSAPMLLDVYLDSRPTERLRGMVLGRLSYDPFLTTLFPTPTPPSNPSVGLDQAWLTFDIEHTVFVTAGRQHVRWGTGHFFSPTDFLSSTRRDPLAPFDTRLGVTMLRANVPWEATGWNFTGVALFEPTQVVGTPGVGGTSGSTLPQLFQPVSTTNGGTLGYVGGAARAEIQLGQTVIGLDGLAQKNRKPRLGADMSSPLGPLDVYAEGLLIQGSDSTLYAPMVNPPVNATIFQKYQATAPSNLTPGVVVGFDDSFQFQDNKSIDLGIEYFYNGTGYSDAHIYPWLILNGVYQPFYVGEHYLAVSATYTNPTAKTTYRLSNIGNLSDQSYLARFDFSVTVLSYLSVEAFADYHYGTVGGELRFSIDTTAANAADSQIPAVVLPIPTFDVGVGLRLAL